ncbi:MAG: sulfate adenylyltransferase subunit CysN [Polyangiaceae bacterium]
MQAELTLEGVEEYLRQHEQKELLRFVAVGSVDDGKSTLIGRLLHDTHGIYEDQLAAVESASKKRGSAGDKLDLALLTDGLKAEREQGITIDVAYRYFSTDQRKFIIADTPGHVQYTRNMATGASTADVALILIDARLGVLQQSRRHAYIASLLGIPHLAVCVNKMDLVDFDEARFLEIRDDFRGFSDGLGFKDVHFVPVSAIDGDNVVHPSRRTPWNRAGTVLQYLETVPIADDRNLSDLRFPVQYVLRPNLDYRGFAGQVLSGVVRKGDEIVIMPSGKVSRVAAIDTFEGELTEAYAPMSVAVRLADEIDVSRGDMIVHQGREPFRARRAIANLVWMSERPLDVSRSYLLKHTTRMVRARIDRLLGKTDLETLVEHPAGALVLNDIARVELSFNQQLFLDRYRDNRGAGAFVLIDAISNDTVAAGMIDEPLEEQREDRRQADRSRITGAERRARLARGGLGHSGFVIAFAESMPLAFGYELERLLFDAGLVTTVIDLGELADASRSERLIADVASQCVRAGVVTLLVGDFPRAADRDEVVARFEELLWLSPQADAPRDHAVVSATDPEAAAAVVLRRLRARGAIDPDA